MSKLPASPPPSTRRSTDWSFSPIQAARAKTARTPRYESPPPQARRTDLSPPPSPSKSSLHLPSPSTPSRAFVAGQRRRKDSPALRDEETRRKDSLGFAETRHWCKGASMSGPSNLSPEPTCKGLQGRSGQDPRGRAKRKDSLSPAVSRHRRKGAPVLGPSPHSPVDTGVRTRRCSGQSATSQAASPRTARAIEPRGRAKRKDSLNPAVSRHRRKGAPVLGPSPHSPVDTGVRTRRCSGQSTTSQAASSSIDAVRRTGQCEVTAR